MPSTEFIATGFHVPERVVTNQELTEYWDTSDEWIRERSGIETRRWVERGGETASDLALEAVRKALAQADMDATDLDCIVYATLSPEHYFPGGGVFLQRKLGVTGIPALDVRNQCSGFLYGLSVADAWVRTGQYRRVLLVGAEVQSPALEYEYPEGRNMGVLFGDGAGAAILGPTDDPGRGVLGTNLFSDGRYAELLWVEGAGMNKFPWISHEDIEGRTLYPRMEGREVFKHAVKRMPESMSALLAENDLQPGDIDLLIAHQANLRINEMVAKRLGLGSDQVYNNIERFGNTTAATIPIALDECARSGRLKRGDLLALTAFGAGFTWGSALIRW
jgi:3-oxoacyl-[acyl-carrier-protein] synthase-3